MFRKHNVNYILFVGENIYYQHFQLIWVFKKLGWKINISLKVHLVQCHRDSFAIYEVMFCHIVFSS